jgi:G:T-mismatch repair DNA endonuclease (very short patch repair protein)
MIESETPRTDAIWHELGQIPTTTTEKWLDSLARMMEREIASLNQFANTTARDRDEWMTRAIIAQAKESK